MRSYVSVSLPIVVFLSLFFFSCTCLAQSGPDSAKTVGLAARPRYPNDNELNRRFAAALKSGDVDSVAWCLDHGANPDEPLGYMLSHEPIDFTPPWFSQLILNHLEVLRLLLDRGARIDFAKALFMSGELGQVEIARFLVSREPQISADMPPLMLAVALDSLELVEAALARHPNIDSVFSGGATVLVWASAHGQCRIVQALLAAGAAPDASGLLSPLMWAARAGHDGVVKELLAAGAKVNFSYQHLSPLSLAVSFRQREIAEDLLDAGADPNWCGLYGNTPLLVSTVWKDSPEMASLLLDRGADIDAKNGDGRSALAESALRDSSAVLPVLIAKGADLNLRDNSSQTPLMLAAANGSLFAVAALLKAGADLELKTDSGRTALDLAREKGHPDTAEYLQSFIEARQKP